MLNDTFLLSLSNSAIAASIRSEPTNLAGRASAKFIAIWDFFITNSNSQPSGFTKDLYYQNSSLEQLLYHLFFYF